MCFSPEKNQMQGYTNNKNVLPNKKKEAQNKMYSKMRTTITEETDDLACK
jgi:hypothetical protein